MFPAKKLADIENQKYAWLIEGDALFVPNWLCPKGHTRLLVAQPPNAAGAIKLELHDIEENFDPDTDFKQLLEENL